MYPPPTRSPHPLPPGGCDCHVHVFGPFERYPLATARSYTPPPAPLRDLLDRLDAAGIDRAVIVQPSAYGTDNRCMLDALRTAPTRLRGVAVIDGAESDAALAEMHGAGVRGVRLNLLSARSADDTPMEETLDRIGARIAPLGWHLQIYADPATISRHASQLGSLGLDVVLDHMANLEAARGATHDQFETIARLLDTGHVWIKLSGTYRVSNDLHGNTDVTRLARALVATNRDRMVWGSDWPHIGAHGGHASSVAAAVDYRPVDYGRLASLLAEWAVDDGDVRRILCDNAARLYDFA